eukprot:10379018-Ditylum_brightwellii.AAC.1
MQSGAGFKSNVIHLIVEESSMHDKIVSKMFLELDKLKHNLVQDHSKSNSFLQESIEETAKELKRLSVQIISMQKNIAGMKSKIRGFSIAAAKPKPPEAPPPLKIISMPSNHCCEIETDDVDNEDNDNFLSHDCLEDYLNRLHAFARGNALLPSDKVITSAQKEAIQCAINRENNKARTLHEKMVQDHVYSQVVFQKEMEAYKAIESEREENLSSSKNELLILENKLLHLRDLKSTHENEQHRLVLEMNAEEKCWDSLQATFNEICTFKCKILLEAKQGMDQISSLQDQLYGD